MLNSLDKIKRITDKTFNPEIWLVDFTHTGQGLASDAIPAAIGMVAEFTEKFIENLKPIKIFKFPETLNEALIKSTPDIIGFSNYVWNYRLSYQFLSEIKLKYPNIITIWGGPNAPSNDQELIEYMDLHKKVDFYIVKEAEVAFAKLIEKLIYNSGLKNEDFLELPNLVFRDKNKVMISNKLERVMDLESIPSPYLSGRLNKFLNGKLMPIIQTNRGCPFSCSFCTEGQTYWNKVRKKSTYIISKELEYISKALTNDGNLKRTDLLIADSNFGMFPEDLETCKEISKSQELHGYPSYINVATGKNKKERVLEAARLVNGAMKLAGSVQSLDPDVQSNMKRSNISSEQIVDMALDAKNIGTNTYSEVILCLPGDTKSAHENTIKTLVNADFSTISMYQLMILPGTEFGSIETINKYNMELKYRVVPRAFGYYDIFDKKKRIAEIEAICVSNSTMPYEDYLECRKLNLIINIFFNDRVFEETIKILKFLKVDIFSFFKSLLFYKHSKKFNELIELFVNETRGELFSTLEEAKEFFENPDNYDGYINGEFGANLIFKYKTLSLTFYFNDICEVLIENLKILSEELNLSIDQKELLTESVIYRKLQIENIFDEKFNNKSRYFRFKFDNVQENYVQYPKKYLKSNKIINFGFNKNQKKEISNYISLFGKDIIGVSRILSRARITNFYRKPF